VGTRKWWLKRRDRLKKELAMVERYIQNHNWAGPMKFKKQSPNNIWRKSIYDKDMHTCVMCGRTDFKCHAHHVFSKTKFPHLKYDPRNGVCLCEDCHLNKVHKDGESCDLIDSIYERLFDEAWKNV
jgi:5-methylcytosine-specific restriction endonuclease McrA